MTTIPMVDEWKRDPEDSYVYKFGSNIKLNLRKFLPKSAIRLFEKNPEAMEACETLAIKRTAFQNKISDICQYIDFFIEYFDSDKELPSIYLNLKKMMDDGELNLTPSEFSTFLFRDVFCRSNIKYNIYRMVETCYHIDVTIDSKSGRAFVDPDDFTNEDVKRLLAISTMMKLLIPPIEHYISSSKVYDPKKHGDLTLVSFVEIFYKTGNGRLTGDVDNPIVASEAMIRVQNGEDTVDEVDLLLAKMYKFVLKRLKKHNKNHNTIWQQQAALRGLTENTHQDKLLTKYLIYDNFFKFNFRDNIVSFLQSIVETQLKFTINIIKYRYDPVLVDNVKTQGSELSSIDKLEQSMVKVDETQVIKAELAIESVMDRLIKEVGPISEDEIDYYQAYLNSDNLFRNNLLEYYFAKEFGGFTELKSMPDRQYIMLTIIAKRRLRRDGFHQVQWLMSAISQGKVSNRLVQNTKYTNKLSQSSGYQHLMKNKYSTLEGYRDDVILSVVSKVLNNVYRFVEYEQKELTGEIIAFDEDVISDELMNLIDAF